MKNPLWGPDELPDFAVFVDIPCIYYDNNYGLAISWNHIVKNPQPDRKLLGISIRPISKRTISDKTFFFESCPENFFKFESVITSFRKLRQN